MYLDEEPIKARHPGKEPEVKIGSATVIGHRRLRHFGMDVQNCLVILMKSNHVRKGAHDRFEPGESRAISLRHAKCSHCRFTGPNWFLKPKSRNGCH